MDAFDPPGALEAVNFDGGADDLPTQLDGFLKEKVLGTVYTKETQ